MASAATNSCFAASTSLSAQSVHPAGSVLPSQPLNSNSKDTFPRAFQVTSTTYIILQVGYLWQQGRSSICPTMISSYMSPRCLSLVLTHVAVRICIVRAECQRI